uniref:Uncharacterized protein n=1 Tax=Myoviridae sp. ctCo31 TaxID=2825053 RepID=A0A8S5UMC7_9CAUD|nr:MAG TPA: hypothetical protein [Myoviridae sp. ctCo31]
MFSDNTIFTDIIILVFCFIVIKYQFFNIYFLIWNFIAIIT